MNYDRDIQELLATAEDLKFQEANAEAIKILQKVVLAEPDCFEAYEELGDNYLSMRDLDRAEKALRQAVKISPKSANAHYLLGFLYSIQQNWKSSTQELEVADELFPNHPEILRCLGWASYNFNRKSQQGVAILERSRNLNPNDPNILCDLGVCYMNQNSFDRAEDLFKKVIQMIPNSEQAIECQKFIQMMKSQKQEEKK